VKKDILFPSIENVHMVVAKDGDGWKVFLINRRENTLHNVLITSKGYGTKDGEEQKTSTLRHSIHELPSGEHALIEPIDPSVFHLNNEYWLSFYIDDQLYDKKYIFVPDSIIEENLSHIPEINMRGILHP